MGLVCFEEWLDRWESVFRRADFKVQVHFEEIYRKETLYMRFRFNHTVYVTRFRGIIRIRGFLFF